jgi:TolB-like protein/Tfp pilus assembly protein PilF
VLIQVLTNILPVFQAPAWVLKTLMILLAIGLPIWMVFSWVYEVTPEGIKKTADVSSDESVTATTNKRLNILILILLVIAIGLNFIDSGASGNKVGVDNSDVVSNPETTRENSIAVLPFLDMSPLKDQEHYSDGIAIEILNGLCKFKKLKVVGRTSSFAFKNKEEDLKSIGQKLNVNNVLEGSVQKQQDQIRISVRLTDASNGYTLFSESYTDEVENIFDLQERIAIDIAEKIESKLELQDNELHPRKKIDPLAYETYLKGKLQFLNGPLDMKRSEVFKAKKYFEHAVHLDSSFAEANAYLALAFFNLSDWAITGSSKEQRKSALDSARILARRALVLDPLSSGARLAMGSYYFHEYDWAQAETEKRKAVELNPGGAEEKFILASFLSQFSQPEEAIALSEEALKLNPLDPSSELKHIKTLFFSGRFQEGVDRSKLMIEKGQLVTGAYQFLSLCNMGLDQFDEAGKAFGKQLSLNGQEMEAEIFFENDFQTACKKLLEINEIEELPILDRNIYKASFYANAGDRENAIRYLYEVYENQEPEIAWMKLPRFEFLREDPRYIELYEKAGLKAYDEQLRSKKGITANY